LKQFSATYVKTLKEALVAAFWFKNELKDFLKASLRKPGIIDTLDWNNKEKRKREIIGDLFALMEKDERSFVPDFDSLSMGILEITRYPSLEKLEDAEKRLAEAKATREALRKCVEEHNKNSTSRKKSLEYDFFKAEYERRKREDGERSRRRAADDELREKNPDKYYGRILRLKGKITKEAIKEHYREMIKLYHPDRFSSLDEEFIELATIRSQKIIEAYDYLRNKFGID
jgi:hypothetical protein